MVGPLVKVSTTRCLSPSKPNPSVKVKFHRDRVFTRFSPQMVVIVREIPENFRETYRLVKYYYSLIELSPTKSPLEVLLLDGCVSKKCILGL